MRYGPLSLGRLRVDCAKFEREYYRESVEEARYLELELCD